MELADRGHMWRPSFPSPTRGLSTRPAPFSREKKTAESCSCRSCMRPPLVVPPLVFPERIAVIFSARSESGSAANLLRDEIQDQPSLLSNCKKRSWRGLAFRGDNGSELSLRPHPG